MTDARPGAGPLGIETMPSTIPDGSPLRVIPGLGPSQPDISRAEVGPKADDPLCKPKLEKQLTIPMGIRLVMKSYAKQQEYSPSQYEAVTSSPATAARSSSSLRPTIA